MTVKESRITVIPRRIQIVNLKEGNYEYDERVLDVYISIRLINYYFVVRRCVSRIIFRGKGLNTGEYNLTSHLRRICVRDIEMYVLERMLLKY